MCRCGAKVPSPQNRNRTKCVPRVRVQALAGVGICFDSVLYPTGGGLLSHRDWKRSQLPDKSIYLWVSFITSDPPTAIETIYTVLPRARFVLSRSLSLSHCLTVSISLFLVYMCVYMCSRLGSHGQQCSLFPQVCVYAFHVVSVYDFCAAFPSCIPGGVSNNSLAPCTGRRQVPTLSPYAANVVMGPVFAAPSFRPVLH